MIPRFTIGTSDDFSTMSPGKSDLFAELSDELVGVKPRSAAQHLTIDFGLVIAALAGECSSRWQPSSTRTWYPGVRDRPLRQLRPTRDCATPGTAALCCVIATRRLTERRVSQRQRLLNAGGSGYVSERTSGADAPADPGGHTTPERVPIPVDFR